MAEKDVIDEIELEVVDDTPPEDQGREPMPKELVKELEEDELEDYSEKVKSRLKQMKKVWHDERREENTQQLYDQHALWIPWWEELRLISPSTPEFKNRLREIWDHVTNHIRQEENTMLVAIDNNMSSKETEQLAARFVSVKNQLEKRNTGAYYGFRQND